MQTQMMAEREAGLCWLECHTEACEAPDRTDLRSFPFTIGRMESADLQVNSGRVSREHAVILSDGTNFRVRDQGSTNGTRINGEEVDESALCDGDLLMIGDTEFTFHYGQSEGTINTETLVISKRGSTGTHDSAADQIDAVRRMHEMLLHGAFAVELQPIVEIRGGRVIGYRCPMLGNRYENEATKLRSVSLEVSCRLTERYRQGFRYRAAEQFALADDGGHLFLDFDPNELYQLGSLRAHLVQLRTIVPRQTLIVVQLPATTACDVTQDRDFVEIIDELDMRIGCTDFVGSRAQLLEYEDAAPSFVTLRPSMTSNLRRQGTKTIQLSALASTCAEIGCRPILNGQLSQQELALCQEIGFELAVRHQSGVRETSALH